MQRTARTQSRFSSNGIVLRTERRELKHKPGRHRGSKRSSFAVANAALALVLTLTSGCSTWQGVLRSDVMAEEAESLVGKRVRLYRGQSVQEMRVERVDFPYIEGTPPHSDGSIRVDLRTLDRIELHKTNVSKPLWITAGVVAGLIILGAILVDEAFNTGP